MVSNSMDLETCRISLKLAQEHGDLVHAALGIHPWSVSQLKPDELEQAISFTHENASYNGKVVAIGEIGLDPQYAKRRAQREEQARVFHEMLKLAEELALPAIVHSRWSAQKILEILPSYTLKAVLWHWFSGPVELLPRIIERGDCVSEGPPVVFSERIQEIIRIVPLTQILSETDGPVRYYGPFKDQPNTPALIPEVVKAIGDLKKTGETATAEQILANSSGLFNIQP
jgi:TatD DNase family protein